MSQPRLTARPISLRSANAWVDEVHRHHQSARGHKFSLAAFDEDGAMRAVAIAGRPSSRHLDDGLSLEVVRLASDGCPNACSFLYGRVARVARLMGYEKVVTYIRADEPGTSLKAAGWRRVTTVRGQSWDRRSRVRIDKTEIIDRVRYEAP